MLTRSVSASSRVMTLAAPVKGWNTRQALADMDPLYAPILDNFFPETEQLTTRRGFESYATGMSGDVETLIEFNDPGGSDELFAANGDSIYDITSGGAVGAAAVSSLTNAQWQQTQINTAGSTNYVLIVNGADGVRSYNGSSWADESSNYTSAGLTVANIVWINQHQNRIWFGEEGTMDAWYLGTQAKSGAGTKFPMGGLFDKGGKLMGMGTWSRDSGDGQDDFAVFVTSEGQAAVYAGTDPSSASTWGLVGVFNIPKPIGRRFFIKAGSDLLLITQSGIMPASRILAVDKSEAEKASLSANVDDALNTAVRSYGSNFGWQPIIYPKSAQLIINVPQGSNKYHQYVVNTITGAWCRFTGMNAVCWGMLNDNIYFGGSNGVVYKADSGNDDDGISIVADAMQAFNYLGNPRMIKNVQMIDPHFKGSQDPEAAIDVMIDFAITSPTSSTTPSAPTAGVWDSAVWDQDVWGANDTLFRGWRGITGIGRAIAPRVGMSVMAGQTSWIATSVMFTEGGYF